MELENHPCVAAYLGSNRQDQHFGFGYGSGFGSCFQPLAAAAPLQDYGLSHLYTVETWEDCGLDSCKMENVLSPVNVSKIFPDYIFCLEVKSTLSNAFS